MSFLFAKPATSTSTSRNVNNGLLTSTYGGTMNAGTHATAALSSLLTGGGDTAGAQAGYSNYLQQAGYAPAMAAMSKGVVGQGAAAGLLNSGSTATALQSKGAALDQSFYNNYLQQLTGLGNQGLAAGQIVEGAGNTQNSSSTGEQKSQAGQIAGLVGGVASIFSDRRLKTDIEKLGEEPDGLGIYRFRYFGHAARIVGVMADEVAKLRPWALGPVRAGFATVNYGAL